MDVWFEDGTIRGVEYLFALLTRVSSANSGYEFSLFNLLPAFHVYNTYR